jgi:hypothetical protein
MSFIETIRFFWFVLTTPTTWYGCIQVIKKHFKKKKV